jgi:hypothetical protein
MRQTHRHTARTSAVRPFFGGVARVENRAAHGNVTRVERCGCGAERRVNINGRHVERGAWVATETARRA